jgi:PAS domain S-box-containing protein
MVQRVQQAFAARGASEERYRRLVQAMPLPVWVYDVETLRILAVNDSAVAHYGYGRDEFLSMTIAQLRPPEDVPRLLDEVRSAGDRLRRSANWRHVKKDGTVIEVETSGHAIEIDGRRARIVVVNDVTEKRRIEQQLRQALKMDAVGKLAAGIAHDFNNLLTVIMSYSDLLASELEPDDPRRADVEEIRRSSESAAGLTRQLLAFSRQQVVQPRIVRLNQVVMGTGKMLKRLIGESVELAVSLSREAGAVRIDTGQLEQVAVNLALNARDAMPHGGRLLIETKNVDFAEPTADEESLYPPGHYVMLAVSDNGVGMDKPTQARIFEPFFTTKDPGRGTGLGLATVYGIVSQNGGFISVYSEPGRGTSFKVYFPRVDDPVAVEEAVTAGEPPGGKESILVVEDDAAVRTLVRQSLQRLGYHVLEAPDGESALAVAAKHPEPIHLVLTDLIMPRMSGRNLAEKVVELRPDVAVLYVSGYTDDALVHHGVLEAGANYLEKPFTFDALARKVRQVLDSTRAESRA